MNKYIVFAFALLAFVTFVPVAEAAVSSSQAVTLSSGWNIVSTPKVLDSHAFSAAETSANFDIYVLDASQTSGWATMAQEGQTEFTPLYGYFINNKTGVDQTLTLNYKADVAPNDRLFSRTFTTTGWYSFGVANPSYALTVGMPASTDTNNPSSILNGLSGYYDMAVDLTSGWISSDADKVAISPLWQSAVASSINSLNDFRETKGYAVFINKTNGLLSGLQSEPKPGAVVVSVSAGANQSVVSGLSAFTVSNLQFDATQSGQDVSFSAIKVKYTDTGLATGDITNCFAWSGATRLNSTGINPTTNATEYQFSLDTNLVVTKGTVKTVAIKCDIPSSLTTGSFAVGLVAQPGTSSDTFSATGVSSGTVVYPTTATTSGATFSIIGTGTLSVVADSSTPTYRVVAGGTTGVNLGVLKFHATNEAINLTRVALQMSNSSALSSPNDLSQVTLWDGATQVGTALFTGSSRNATSTLTTTVTVPANSDKIITIKGDMSNIGTSLAGTEGALVQVDYDADDTTGTQGLGVSSGSQINASGADTAFAGVRMFRSYPTVAQAGTNGTLAVGSSVTLDKFTVTANSAGSISLDKFTISVATSSASTANGTTTVSSLKVYAYTDSSYSSPVGGSFVNGQVVGTISSLSSSGDNDAVLSSILTIPAGTTYYFAVKGTVAQIAGTTGLAGTVTTKLGGDAAYPVAIASLMGQAADVDGDANDNFIWSPNATTTSSATANDWTNGYLISGLPTDYLNGTTLTK